MSRYIEKIVIPKSSLHTMAGPIRRGVVGVASHTTNTMSDLLENTSLKRDEKMKMYNQSLNRLMALDQQISHFPNKKPPGVPGVVVNRDPPTPPRDPPTEPPHQDISSTLPPTLRTKGSALLRNLAPTLQWNDREEISWVKYHRFGAYSRTRL